jgi:MYXO-CTERM domain-containing protein
MWQAEVAAGTAPAATMFTTITSPILFDIGALSGDRSLEFIFNGNAAAAGSVSSALIGTQSVANGRQGLKYEQWNDTGFFGATAFGVADYTSTIPVQDNVTLHAVFTSSGATTDFYLNGSLAYTFDSLGLALTGVQGLGAASNADGTGFFDVLTGSVHGFASYDSALSPSEISSHFSAFTAVPEPGSAALAALAGLACLGHRRRRVQ